MQQETTQQRYHQQTYQIASVDADAACECRPSCLLAYMQRAITAESELYGATQPDMMRKYNAAWMVLRSWVRLYRPILLTEWMTVRVTVRKPQGSRLYRDCDFFVGETQVGEATTLWVLIDRSTGAPRSMEGMPEFPAEDPPTAKSITLSRISFPSNMVLHDRRRLYYSDIDLNGHMNNTRYLDLAADAAELDRRARGVFVQELQIGYINACYAGEQLQIYRGRTEEDLYIHGIGPDGTDRFDCVIRMSDSQI